jgi:hypothetical protein
VAGSFVHVFYAFPSDGADRTAELAPQISSDVDEIDAWWRGQDPTRVPRFDVFPYSCGLQIDLSAVRLPIPAAQLAPLQGRANTVVAALVSGGLSSLSAKYLVYYDGPSNEPNVCGQSGLNATGTSFSFVYLGTCSGVPTAPIAAHELIHGLGALPAGAPHPCSANDVGHPCDSTQDIMYPFASGQPLASHLLDVNHDDYYAHAGSWFDLQDSSWLRRLDAQVPVAITISGRGTVRSFQPGPECMATCTVEWDSGSSVQLEPTSAAGQRFVRWSGSCTGLTCTLQMTEPRAVTALFAQARFALTVAVTGKGVVRSTPRGIACRVRCSASFTSFQAVRLTAAPLKGWRFLRWTGACAGTRLTCSVPMRAATLVRGTFVKRKPGLRPGGAA